MRLILLSVSLFFMGIAKAQLHGVVRDQEDKPLAAATVVLYKAADSGIVKTAITNDGGAYSIVIPKPGNYFIKASSVGFKDGLSSTFEFTGVVVELPSMVMQKKQVDLANVIVKTQRPMIEVKADKMVFNIEANATATGLDGMELLRQAPGVLVDHEDNISLAGKSGVQIFIDGKPSPLTAKDLSNYLRSLRSASIDAIEIISNPSAKYDAAGTGGIINIRLKKNSSYGTNGSVNSDFQQGTWAKFNSGFTLNNRNRAVNVFGNYNYSKGRNEFDLDVYRHVLDSLFDSYSATITHYNTHNFKAGLDKVINKYSTLGLLVSGNFSDDMIYGDNVTYIKSANNLKTDRLLVANNVIDAGRKTMNYNVNYVYADPKGKNLNIDADYGRFRMNSDQFQPNEFFDSTRSNKLNERNYTMITPSDIDIYSFKTDYEQDFQKGRLALGMKTAYISSDNIFNSFNHLNRKLIFDSVLSNHFVYRENINAVYASFNKGFKNVQIMFGLRLEQTVTKGRSTGFKKNGNGFENYGETFTRKLLNLFPSGNITFTKNPKTQWTLSYSRRINRPSYQDLNPFEKRGSEYGGFKGNPNLRPELAHTFSLINVYKSRLVTNLSFTVVDNVIVSISDTLNGTKSFYFPKNLAQQKNVSLSSNYSFTKKWFSMTSGATGYYTHNNANFGPGRAIDLKVLALTSFVQTNAKFGKGWSTNMRVFYESPKLFRGTMQQRAFYGMNMGIQKMLFEERSTLRINFNDVFNTVHFFGTSNFAGQYLHAWAWWEPRRIVVSFNYRFGSSQVKSTRQRRTGIDEESQRATTGGN